LISITAQAQKSKKYSEIHYKDISVESEDVTITTNNGFSNKELTKFKLKLINKTGDILMYKPEESTLKVSGKEFKPKEKTLLVYPGESDFRVVNYLSPDFLVPNYSYVVSGIYKVTLSGTTQEAAEFKLPASQNDFKAGNFNCTMTSLTKETDKTKAEFECTYVGSKIGVINPGKAAVKMPDGTEIANEKKSSSPIVMTKGKSEKITFKWNRMEGGKSTDMQKVTMMILFRNTFTEADPVKCKEETIEFAIDEALSK
jgi:hypothetical protein